MGQGEGWKGVWSELKVCFAHRGGGFLKICYVQFDLWGQGLPVQMPQYVKWNEVKSSPCARGIGTIDSCKCITYTGRAVNETKNLKSLSFSSNSNCTNYLTLSTFFLFWVQIGSMNNALVSSPPLPSFSSPPSLSPALHPSFTSPAFLLRLSQETPFQLFLQSTCLLHWLASCCASHGVKQRCKSTHDYW